MNFQREPLRDFFTQAEALFADHWNEVGTDNVALAHDTQGYFEACDAGILHCYTARNEAGLLLGYAFFWVTESLMTGIVEAMQDTLYLRPSSRRLGDGMRFIDWCDYTLEREGVKIVRHCVDDKHDYSKTLTNLGYRKIQTVYERTL